MYKRKHGNSKGTSVYKINRLICFIILFVFLPSCATSNLDLSLDFYAPPDESTKSFRGILGVDEFIDLRPQITTSDAKKWLGFIPGVLWLKFISEIPDTYAAFSSYNSGPFRMSVAHAIYTYIEQSKIFENQLFLPKDKYAKIDYRLEGVLNRTSLKETGYYYGSSFYAWVTRIIGLPYVSYELSVDITLRLRRTDTNEIFWTYELKGSRTDKYYSIYQLTKGKDGKHIISYNFSKILETEMPPILKSMRKAIENQ